jgi:hypothetical protein
MKKILLFLFFTSFLGLQSTEAQNEKFKALFMYNFTKYLEWPSNKNDGDFIITVVGESPIVKELNIIAQKKQIGFQNLKVEQVHSASEISSSHIVYVSSESTNMLNAVLSRLSKQNTLLITDKKGSIGKGAGINYIVQGGKQKFEISESNIASSGIKVGTTLLSLGIPR